MTLVARLNTAAQGMIKGQGVGNAAMLMTEAAKEITSLEKHIASMETMITVLTDKLADYDRLLEIHEQKWDKHG